MYYFCCGVGFMLAVSQHILLTQAEFLMAEPGNAGLQVGAGYRMPDHIEGKGNEMADLG